MKKIKPIKYFKNSDEINEVLDTLEAEYPDAGCALHHDSIFHLLLAVVLSAQTTDASVNTVTPELFSTYHEPADLSAADINDVEDIIKKLGLYKNKAKNLVGIGKLLCSEYDGVVPQDFTELQKLPGVGRKTANVVLSVGFGEQHIAVDTHVFRVTNRIGLVDEDNVLKTERSLMEIIPKHRWSHMHHVFIFLGRRCCTARKPKCESCCIADKCKYNQK